jgi:hypothetical protein
MPSTCQIQPHVFRIFVICIIIYLKTIFAYTVCRYVYGLIRQFCYTWALGQSSVHSTHLTHPCTQLQVPILRIRDNCTLFTFTCTVNYLLTHTPMHALISIFIFWELEVVARYSDLRDYWKYGLNSSVFFHYIILWRYTPSCVRANWTNTDSLNEKYQKYINTQNILKQWQTCCCCYVPYRRPLLSGISFEPAVIPAGETSSFRLRYFPHYIRWWWSCCCCCCCCCLGRMYIKVFLRDRTASTRFSVWHVL